jgi:hypothetical protein
MSEVRLIVRDARRQINGTCHGATADRVVAALSTEPETIEEVEAGMARFAAPEARPIFRCFGGSIDEEPYDAGLVVIDLTARLIAVESTYSSPGKHGYVDYHDGKCATDITVRYHLPDDWLVIHSADWRATAEARRRERAGNPPLDVRAVLYGKPLLEFIAAECLTAFGAAPKEIVSPPDPADFRGPPSGEWAEQCLDRISKDEVKRARIRELWPSDEDYEKLREIHARWLMTPREDLRGATVREVLFARQSFIGWDLQDRSEQWSLQGTCPPPLDRNSAAYKLAGIGTHEWVKYYDLVRMLLWSCREALGAGAGQRDREDFLAAEAARLETAREAWFDEPDLECHGITPREIIDHERLRIPEGMSGHDAMIDDDCPMCQMMADMPGPMFWHLDGCNMEDEFVFSSDATLEEWEERQRDYEEMSRRYEAKQAERERLGIESPGDEYRHPESVWQRSFVADDSPGLPLELRLFTIGSLLAEIVVDLKMPVGNALRGVPQESEQRSERHGGRSLQETDPDEHRSLIDALSRDFGNLREVSRSNDPAFAAALIEPVLYRFCVTLENVAAARPDLAEKCEDLDERLGRFLEVPSEKPPEFDAPGDFDDIPF